jgi:hypothetical protein
MEERAFFRFALISGVIVSSLVSDGLVGGGAFF